MHTSKRTLRVVISVLTLISTLVGMVPWAPVAAVRGAVVAEGASAHAHTMASDEVLGPLTLSTTFSHTLYLPLVAHGYTPPISEEILPETGGRFELPERGFQLELAPNAVSEPTNITFQSLAPPALPADKVLVGDAFALTAQTATGEPVTHFIPQVVTRTIPNLSGQPLVEYDVTNTVVLTLTYTGAQVAGLDEARLQIHTRQGNGAWQPLLTVVDTTAKTAAAPLNHFSEFALLGVTASPTQTWVILDPDHGGADPGGRVTSPVAYAIEEKTVNLDAALAARDWLQMCGVNVLMTREDDSTIAAGWRADFINSHAPDAAVTVAFNIASSQMQYFFGGPMGLADFSKPEDQVFAQTLVDSVGDVTGLTTHRGIRDARDWRGGLYLPTHVPDVLYTQIESAFIDSYNDRDNVIDPKLEYVAGGIYNGIIATLELTACTPFSGTVTNEHLRRTLGVSNNGTRYTAQGVNPVTGNQFQWFRDLFVPGVGLNVDLVRYYNSQSQDVGLFGKGWSSLYDMRIDSLDGGVLQVKYADGHRVNFTPTGNGYQPEPGNYDTLVVEGADYVLTTPSQIRFTFDSAGILQTIADEDGNAITLQYTGTRLAAILDDAGRTFDVTTNGVGLITGIEDPLGRVVTYTYGVMSLARTAYLQDLRGPQALMTATDLLAMTNANGGQTQYEYDAAGGYLNRVSDPMGITYLDNVYTPDGKVQSQRNGNQDQGEWDYDIENMQATFTDNEGNKTIYYFDSQYRVIREEDALGYTVEYEYDDGDNITLMRDKRGNVWRYTYDERGNMLTREDPLDGWSLYVSDVTTWTYDDKNNPLSMTDALGNTWTYQYDDKGNPTYILEPNGAETTAVYDSKGQMISLTDAEGRLMTFVYDGNGNRTETHFQDGGWIKSTYDNAGHELTRSVCLNPPACSEVATTTNVYDNNGNVTRQTDPMGEPTLFEYDGNNMLIKKTDRRGGVWEYRYDDELNPLWVKDPLGRITEYTYDKMSHRLTAKDPLGRITTFEYDDLYRMIRVMDPMDNLYRYEYDPNGNLLAFTDPLNQVTRFTYDVTNRRKYIHDALGGTTEYCYDPLDRIVQAFDPRRAEVRLRYDSVGNQVEVRDPLGNRITLGYDRVRNLVSRTVGIPSDGVEADGATTTFEYDVRNRRITQIDPLNRITRMEYDGAGNMTRFTDARIFSTEMVYNKNGWMTLLTDARGGETRYEYDGEGATTALVDARNHRTEYAYDLAGQLETVTDPLNQVTEFEYDRAGNQVRVINARGGTTNYEYNELNLLFRETDPLSHSTEYGYDALRRMTSRTDANGITTEYGYNALGWLTSVTDAINGVTTYEYDAVGNRTAIIDANGVSTTFEYNFLDQLTREINPLGNTWRYSYDARGNMIRRVDGKWQATYYEYDQANQLTATVYGIGAGENISVTFEYDDNGNEIAMRDWNGLWGYEYDELNRRTRAEDPWGRGLEWEYDAVGNRAAMVYPSGQRVEMTYDEADQLDALTDFAGRAHTWDYDPLGYITAQVNPNGTRADYVYDAAGRLLGLTNTGPGDALIAGYAYTMDAVGNRVQTVEQRGTESIIRTYEYDDLYRLTRAQTNTGQDMAYVYDQVGNRLEKAGLPEPVGTEPSDPEDEDYTYNALNSMLTAGPVAFGYDPNGNRIRKTEPLTATGYLSVALSLGWEITGTVVTDYGYDYENRLTEVTRAIHYTQWVSVTGAISGTTELTVTQGVSEAMHADYVYDGYGRRVAKHVTTAITDTAVLTAATVFTRGYVFDGLDPVYEFDYTDGPVTPTVESAYVYANGRMVLMERTEDGVSATYWYHYDGLGSVVALTDETGADVCQWRYDEYGNLLQDCPELNHYTYTGQEYDAETGLLHFFARYYDAKVGNWLSEDSYPGKISDPMTLHRYIYAANNPINLIDFLGYSWWDDLKSGAKDIWGGITEGAKVLYEGTKNLIFSKEHQFVDDNTLDLMRNMEKRDAIWEEYRHTNDRGKKEKLLGQIQDLQNDSNVITERMAQRQEKFDKAKKSINAAADWVQEHRHEVIGLAGFAVGIGVGFVAAAAFCVGTAGIGCAIMVGAAAGAGAGVGTGLAIQSMANLLDSEENETSLTSHWGEAALVGGGSGAAGGAVGGTLAYATGVRINPKIIHPPHHGQNWHIQIDAWINKVKGSNRTVFRMPIY